MAVGKKVDTVRGGLYSPRLHGLIVLMVRDAQEVLGMATKLQGPPLLQ